MAFIDFGIVGRISDTVWTALGKLVESFVNEDYRGVAEALVTMGATGTSVDIDKFGAELKSVVDSIANMNPQIVLESYEGHLYHDLLPTAHRGIGVQIDARITVDERETTKIVLDIVSVAENNGLKLPREFGLLLKQV